MCKSLCFWWLRAPDYCGDEGHQMNDNFGVRWCRHAFLVGKMKSLYHFLGGGCGLVFGGS
jgi:hypothetical protein